MLKNNKKTTIVLVALLVVIWGSIGYQIIEAIASSKPDEVIVETPRDNPTAREKQPFIYKPDARDPFQYLPLKPVQVSRPAIVEKIPPPFKLTGIVTNQKKFTVAVEGKDGTIYFLGEGDSLQGLRILKILNSEVRYSYRNQKDVWRLEN